MTDVSFIIVNYNTCNITMNCLKSIFERTKNIKFEVILVDNASVDNSMEEIPRKFPKVKIIKNGVNAGFGNANIMGIREAKGKYLFLLNSDTILLNNAARIFFDFMESRVNEKIGCIGAILLDENETPSLSYGPFHHLRRELKERWFHLFGELLRAIRLRKVKNTPFVFSHNIEDGFDAFDADVVSGADMFVSRDVIDDIGAFDPDFFMYSEEVEWQYRMFLAGWKRMIISGPKIIHLEGKSFRESNPKRIMYNVSKMLFYRKHAPRFIYFLYRFFFLSSIIFEMFVDVFRRRYSFRENRIFFTRCRRLRYF